MINTVITNTINHYNQHDHQHRHNRHHQYGKHYQSQNAVTVIRNYQLYKFFVDDVSYVDVVWWYYKKPQGLG